MARITNKNFLPDFATLEINPEGKGPEVSRDVQMVYVMGNVAPAAAGGSGFAQGFDLPNPILAEYSCQVNIGPTVGESARYELLALATGNGIWINAIYTEQTALEEAHVFTIGAFTGLGTTLLPTAANSSSFGTGGNATAIVEFGTIAGGFPANSIQLALNTSTTARPQVITGDGLTPVYVGAGRVFVVQHTSVNAGGFIGVSWREVP